MERLGLEKETDITCKVYIDPKVLKKQADCGGTTVELKEIHIEKSLAEEEEEKNKSKGERIIGLERKLDEQLLEIERLSKILGTLKGKDRIVEECESIINEKETEIREKDRRIAEIGEVLSNLQNQFNSLQNERNEIQQVANNLENELHRFQGGLLGSLFRNFKKSTEKIKDLKARIVRTGAELFDKDRRIENLNNQIHQLTTQRDNLQTQVNNLNITVGERDRTITGLNNQISSLKGQINSIQNNYDYYYRQYHDKDRKVDNLHSKISSLQNEISILKNKSIDNYQVKSVNIFKSLRVPFRHTTHQIDSCEFYTTKESSVRPSIKHLKSLSRFAFPDDENRAFFQL